jgi:glucoamylase
MRTRIRSLTAALALLLLAAPAAVAAEPPPGGPGATALWTEGDKDGFGTSTTTASSLWHTLDDGELTEVYYPDLGTPAARDLQLVVTDGVTFADREREDTEHRTALADRRSLSYRQVNTDPEGRYRITKTYTTDPARATLLIRVRLGSFTQRPLQVYALYDPALSNGGDDDAGATAGSALTASDAQARAPWSPIPRSGRRRAATSAPATAGPTCAPTSAWTGATRRRRPATWSRPRARRSPAGPAGGS